MALYQRSCHGAQSRPTLFVKIFVEKEGYRLRYSENHDFFAVENQGYRADSNLVPSTLHLVTASLVQGLLVNSFLLRVLFVGNVGDTPIYITNQYLSIKK